MRCKWCANPEGLEFRTNIMHKETLCKPYNACAKTCPLGSVCFKFANEEAPILYDYADKEHPIDVTRYQKNVLVKPI